MVRKGKSLLFGHISCIFKKNGGGTTTSAENRQFATETANLPPKTPFAANFFAISRQIGHFFKKKLRICFKILQVLKNAKSKGIFLKKK